MRCAPAGERPAEEVDEDVERQMATAGSALVSVNRRGGRDRDRRGLLATGAEVRLVSGARTRRERIWQKR